MDQRIAIGASVQSRDAGIPPLTSIKTNNDSLVTISGIMPKTTSSAVVKSYGGVGSITDRNGVITFPWKDGTVGWVTTEPIHHDDIGRDKADSSIVFDGSGSLPHENSIMKYDLYGKGINISSAGNKITSKELIIAQEKTMNWSTSVIAPIGITDLGWSVWIAMIFLIIVLIRMSRTTTWKSILLPVKWAFWAVCAVCRGIWSALRRETEEAKRAWDEIRKDAK